jgi:hypothetical protein
MLCSYRTLHYANNYKLIFRENIWSALKINLININYKKR